MSATGPALVLNDVSVAYGGILAVNRLSLDIVSGETVAVVGPSGSGKSTLLRAIAGLEPLTSGEIAAGGRSLARVATHRRDLGLMFQDHALFPHLDVSANVAFGLRMKAWPANQRRARVDQLLELVGLAGFGAREVHQLSGGEVQRVALARALAPEPSLLMLDEPFGSLDRLLREELTDQLRRLLADLGQTALHVTHDQVEAFAVADRVAVLADGRLQQVGEPAVLWRAPNTRFVAEFLGHLTIWTVDIDATGRMWVDDQWLDGPPLLSPGPATVVVPIGAVTVDSVGELSVQVTQVVFRDGRYRCGGRVGCGDDDGQELVFETTAALRVGQSVSVSIDRSALHQLLD